MIFALLVASAVVSALIRLLPELWLRGEEPPGPLARVLPWLPVAVAGVFVGVLHIGAEPHLRLAYVLAAVPAGLSLLWRRSFFIPILVGAFSLALLRHFTPLG